MLSPDEVGMKDCQHLHRQRLGKVSVMWYLSFPRTIFHGTATGICSQHTLGICHSHTSHAQLQRRCYYYGPTGVPSNGSHGNHQRATSHVYLSNHRHDSCLQPSFCQEMLLPCVQLSAYYQLYHGYHSINDVI